MKAILLVRVSTNKQDFDEQEKELYDLAIKDGYTDEEIIAISEKESGYNLSEEERSGLNRLKELIENDKQINCVYAWEVSRIARKKKISFNILDFLICHNIQLIVKTPFIKLFKDDKIVDDTAEMTFTLYAQFAESEIRTAKARFKRTRIKNAREGKYTGGFIKYGYYIDENNSYQIKEDEADFIRLVFSLYLSGLSEVGVVRELVERGYDKINGTLVNTSKIRNILLSEQYTGLSSEYGYERSYPQIISKEIFESARKKAVENNTNISKAKNIYYASGLIKCTCGTKWMGMKSGHAYFCYKRYNNKENRANKKKTFDCDNRQAISITVLDSLLWSICQIREARYWKYEAEKDIEIYQNEIILLNEKINATTKSFKLLENKIYRISENYEDGLITKKKRDEKIKILNEERKKIKNNKAKWNNEIDNYNFLISEIKRNHSFMDEIDEECQLDYLFNKIRSIKEDEKRSEIIHRHVKEITINEDTFENKVAKRIDITFYNGEKSTYYFLYKSKCGKICFYFDNDKGEYHNAPTELHYEHLNRFK